MRYLHHTSTNDPVAKYPTQWKIYFDPVCSIIFALLILKSSLPLIRHCAAILMQSVPSSISFFDLKKKLLRRNLAATRTRRRRSATASKQLFGRLSGTTRRLFFGSTQLLCGAKHEQLACVGCPCAQRSFFFQRSVPLRASVVVPCSPMPVRTFSICCRRARHECRRVQCVRGSSYGSSTQSFDVDLRQSAVSARLSADGRRA